MTNAELREKIEKIIGVRIRHLPSPAARDAGIEPGIYYSADKKQLDAIMSAVQEYVSEIMPEKRLPEVEAGELIKVTADGLVDEILLPKMSNSGFNQAIDEIAHSAGIGGDKNG